MKLRCIAKNHRQFKYGQFYDVVEILEHFGHAMVRKPNGKWPKPGEPLFGWHADDIFKCPAIGIPAYSCGYGYIELEFFGAVIPHSVFPLGPYNPNKSNWTRLDDLVQIYSRERLWWSSYRGVIPKACFPDNLESRFIVIGSHHRNLRSKISYTRVEKAIQKILISIGIPKKNASVVGDQELEFWHHLRYREAGSWTW